MATLFRALILKCSEIFWPSWKHIIGVRQGHIGDDGIGVLKFYGFIQKDLQIFKRRIIIVFF